MPPTRELSSGSLTGPPLWTLTAAVVLVAGILFYFVSEPLAAAFDLLLPAPPVVEQPEIAAPEPAPAPEPTEPPPPPPRVWTQTEIEAGMAELGETLAQLIEAGRSELPTYEDLGTDDAVKAQRATARWSRWGVVWHNRVEVERSKMPPREQCRIHEDVQDSCTEIHGIMDDLEAVSDALTYDGARTHLDTVEDRLDLYLEPPPPEEEELSESSDDTGSE
ncbi:MAG: hypothetical protein MPN21_02185 [Thermoanaerobaculia bacterium]|nr:hypothetical protein [Thermoanaerobaculia bacterium]